MPTINNINYDEIVELIQYQLMTLVNDAEHQSLYSDCKFVISQEQQFIKLKDKDPKTVYIVVKFGTANVSFGQTALPASVTVLSEQNKLELVQQLMLDYTKTFNLVRVQSNTIQQVYESPAVSGNFNAIYDGWRSLIRFSGAFVISKNSNFFTVKFYYTDKDNVARVEELPIISSSLNLAASPDTQVFYNSKDFTKSIIKMGSVHIAFSTFLLNDSELMNRIIDLLCDTNSYLTYGTDGKPILNPSGSYVTVLKSGDSGYSSSKVPVVNTAFELGIVFRDTRERKKQFKLISFSMQQELGQIPIINISFTE